MGLFGPRLFGHTFFRTNMGLSILVHIDLDMGYPWTASPFDIPSSESRTLFVFSYLALASSPKAFCTEKDHNFLPPIVNLIISRRLDHQRLKLLDAFRAPVAGGSSPDEHDDAADDNSYGGGYNHGGLTILDEHGAQSGGDGLVSGGVRHVGDDN
ncbi:hypothetical protein HID58_075702 [Brassica napus]|uniref:Uncharacterized protein n=1 Tax=Brassica napus TaxID=3708 RepID=A0ABQ7YNK9_BRANA|nr:hypothetical protein HID58_075702 [Brassica napus]